MSGGAEFLGVGVWIFEFLVCQMLPLISCLLIPIFLFKIYRALRNTMDRFTDEIYGGQ